MSYVHQEQHVDTDPKNGEQQLDTPIPAYEIQMNQDNQNSTTMEDSPPKPQVIRQTRSQHAHSQASSQPPVEVVSMEQEITEDEAHESSVITNAEEVEKNEHDSYMGNGADESADVSGSVSGIPEKIFVRVHQTSNSSEMVAITDDDQDVSAHASFEIKPDGKSYKYPLLKRYYEFGPWVGRNRKAICIRCKHQSASSQPERLIKHMKRCSKLSEHDRSLADELLVESNANKKVKPHLRSGDTESEYYADDDQNNGSMISDKPTGTKRIKKMDGNDRKAHIDQALTKFIMCCRIPLKSIHSKEFVEFVRSLDPDYRIPSRETITNVLIPGLLNIL